MVVKTAAIQNGSDDPFIAAPDAEKKSGNPPLISGPRAGAEQVAGAAGRKPTVPPLLAKAAGVLTGKSTAGTILRRTFAVALGVLLWHLAVANDFKFIVSFENVSSPAEVYESLATQLTGSKFYEHIGVSLQRIAMAYGLAAVLGIVIGLAMGRSRIAYDFILPYLEILRPIPAVAWIPLAILMWPTEESSIIYITFLGALFPVVLNTIAGVQQTPEVLVRAARSLGARRMQIFRHVVFPAALPSIATGLSIGMGVAWFSLLAGEIISGQYGIGYFTWTAYHLIKYADIIVGMLTIGLLGSLSTIAVQWATAPLLKWQSKSR